MAKQKEVKTNAMRILESMKIPFVQYTYECDEFVDAMQTADLIGQPYEKLYKTLVTQGKSGAHFVFVVPVEAELDLKKAARSVDEKAVSMIPVKDINKVTGYVRGGCSPVGMKKQFITRIDESAVLIDRIFVSAGRIGQQMELSPDSIVQITGAEYDDITM